MGRKTSRDGRVTGFGYGHSTVGLAAADSVLLKGEITDPGPDYGRPVRLRMTPDEARRWAEHLAEAADTIDARQKRLREAAKETNHG
jgi:hypothetical protein